MIWLFPIAVTTVLTVALVLTGLTIVAYILEMRRRRFEVPFSTLWHRVLREKEATSLWKYLRRLLSLLLQLFILALLVLAVLDPQLGSADDDARNVVIIIDASASMKAVDEGNDGKQSRMEMARQKAHELLGGMGGSDAAMIMRMDGQTTPLGRFDSDIPMLHRVVDSVQASDTPADLARALSAAADALRERKNPLIVLIGDGAYPREVLDSVAWNLAPVSQTAPAPVTPTAQNGEQSSPDDDLSRIDLSGIDVRFIPVGQKSDNVGILAFNARRYLADKTTYTVFIEIQNFGEEAATRKLVVYSGQSPVDVKTVTLQPGEKLREIYPKLPGGVDNHLRAVLQPVDHQSSGRGDDGVQAPAGDGTGDRTDEAPGSSSGSDHAVGDVFALDDEAYALLPARKKQKVLLVSQDNLYLEGAMLVYDSITVDKLPPEDYDRMVADGSLPSYDAVVFDDHTPAKVPNSQSTHLVYFHPSGEHSPFPIRGVSPAPHINEVDEGHPVMRWVVLSDVNFDESAVFTVDRSKGEVALASYVREPLIAAKKDGQRKIVAFGFSLSGTDLTLRVAFPLLLVNILDWFAGDDADLITTYQTGQRFRVAMDGTYGVNEAEVVTPTGKLTRAPIVAGQATFYGNWVGVHKLIARQDGQVAAIVELAANLANPDESRIVPGRELVMGGKTLLLPEGFAFTRQRVLWIYLVLACMLLLAVEWLTYHRRITV